MSMITYRKLDRGDIDLIKEMLFLALFIPPGSEPFDRSIIEDASLSKYWVNWGNHHLDLGVVANDDQNAIGAIWGRSFSRSNPGYGFINRNTPEISMAVIDEYRGRGIGTNLIRMITQHYSAIGVQNISLSVDSRNRAMNLYKRLGFKSYQQNGHNITMRLRISA